MSKTVFIRTPYLLLALLFMSPFTSAQTRPDDIVTATESISYDYFFKHVEYLASDSLKGRGIGTLEYDLAADYLANEFQKNQLNPFGDSNTYFQYIKLLKSSIEESSFSLRIKNGSTLIKADYGDEISVVLNPKYGNIDENQQMVFVGYGNVIPALGLNDYAEIDVVGKTVIVALGGPKSMDHPDFDDRNTKFQHAVDHGATGLILFYPKASLFQNIIFNRVHGFLSQSMLSVAVPSIESFIGNDELKLLLFSKKKLIKKIFTQSGLNLNKSLRGMSKGKVLSQTLRSSINCSYSLNNDSLVSKNVVALLPGSDSTYKNEYVVLGAHLDHFGIGKPIKGDNIYNGMMDNATGISALLSISKAFTDANIRTKRSIVFVGYTAEENGLLGSNYYANKNSIKGGKIVANINIDMLAQTIETHDMAPLGYSHSNLSEGADYAAQKLNLEIDNNLEAEKAYIERSDQISFIKKGIPALFIAGGFTARDPKKNGEKVFNQWMKKRYHTPFDDLDQPYSEAAFHTALKFNFLTTYYISDKLKEIKWNTDSWLFKKYVVDLL